jgi:hypothetical protein
LICTSRIYPSKWRSTHQSTLSGPEVTQTYSTNPSPSLNIHLINIGNKKAKTKSRLLNENVGMAVLDEKFQINTVMECNEDGHPIKDKMVIIIDNKLSQVI